VEVAFGLDAVLRNTIVPLCQRQWLSYEVGFRMPSKGTSPQLID
jgi:hypothetical protein